MNRWKEYELNDVVEKFIDYRGKTPEKTINGIPLVTAKIVKNGNIQTPTEFISYQNFGKWMQRGYPEIDDVVLTTEAPLGEVALLRDKNVAFAQRIIVIRGKKDLCDNCFLKYYLQSPFGQNELQGRVSGTTVEGIKAAELRKIRILLPPLPEQRAIAGVLSSLEDKIDLLHRQNKTLEAIAAALWYKMFVEEANSNWERGKLGDIAEINPLRSIKKGTIATYLDMANMPTSGPFPISWIQREFTSGIKFKNGDTIIARITPCLENGKTAYVNFLRDNEIGWGSTEYIVLSPKSNYCPEWFYFLARNNDFRDYAIQNMTGTSGRQRVTGESIAQYEIFVPPIKEVEQFGTTAGRLIEHIKHNSLEINTLVNLRDILLPELLSGEMKVTI